MNTLDISIFPINSVCIFILNNGRQIVADRICGTGFLGDRMRFRWGKVDAHAIFFSKRGLAFSTDGARLPPLYDIDEFIARIDVDMAGEYRALMTPRMALAEQGLATLPPMKGSSDE